MQRRKHNVVDDADVVGDLLAYRSQLRLLQKGALGAVTSATLRSAPWCGLPTRARRHRLSARARASNLMFEAREGRVARALYRIAHGLVKLLKSPCREYLVLSLRLHEGVQRVRRALSYLCKQARSDDNRLRASSRPKNGKGALLTW